MLDELINKKRSNSVNVAKQTKSQPKLPKSNNNNNKNNKQRRPKQKQQRQSNSNNNNNNSNSNSNDNSNNNNNNTGMPSTYGTRNKPVVNTIRSNLLSLPGDLDPNDVATAIANISQPSQQRRRRR